MFFSFTTLTLAALLIIFLCGAAILFRAFQLRGQKVSWVTPPSFRADFDHSVDKFAYFLVVVVREFVHHSYLSSLTLLHKATAILKIVGHSLEERFGQVVTDAYAKKHQQNQKAAGVNGVKASPFLAEIKDHTESYRNNFKEGPTPDLTVEDSNL
jgi:hypothetical protein